MRDEARGLQRRMHALENLPDWVDSKTVLAMTDEDLDLLAGSGSAGPQELYDWILGNFVRRIERPLASLPGAFV